MTVAADKPHLREIASLRCRIDSLSFWLRSAPVAEPVTQGECMNFGDFDLAALLPFIAVGFAAQLVDGALGMAFGVISNTLLVAVLGVQPKLASQRVHLVECFTTAASAISHLLHRNIDGRLFVRLVVPGMVGGFCGAYL